MNRPSLDNFIDDIRGSRLFKRLEKISFLGVVDYELTRDHVTRTTFSRAQHSIGVLELARRLCTLLELAPNDAYTLCAAALLHDAAHPAFSHSLEYAFRSEERELNHHEALRHALLDSTDISRDLSRTLVRYRILPERVISVIDGSDRLNFFFSNPLNIDTLDGIRRSYWSMGIFVEYDVERLLVLSAQLFLGKTVSDQRSIRNADAFWTMKGNFYERFMTGPYARRESSFQRAVRLHLGRLDARFFQMTDKNFRLQFPEVFRDMDKMEPLDIASSAQRFEIARHVFPLDRQSIFLRYRRRRNVPSDTQGKVTRAG